LELQETLIKRGQRTFAAMNQGAKPSFATISEANDVCQSYGRHTKLSYDSFMNNDINGPFNDAYQLWYDSSISEDRPLVDDKHH
jgi:hypothetical protein